MSNSHQINFPFLVDLESLFDETGMRPSEEDIESTKEEIDRYLHKVNKSSVEIKKAVTTVVTEAVQKRNRSGFADSAVKICTHLIALIANMSHRIG